MIIAIFQYRFQLRSFDIVSQPHKANCQQQAQANIHLDAKYDNIT